MDISEPHVWGVDQDSWIFQDYKYFMEELSKDFDFETFTDEKHVNEVEMGMSFDKEFMHHLDGTVRGININNQLKGSEYVLVTVADYTVSDMWGEPFVESYLQEYMDTRRSGEAGYLYVFLRIWLSTGLLAMLVFLAVFLAVGGFRYMKAKSAYDMKCYRIETTNAMAHDLKTPLTAISGYAENLLSQVQVDKREYYAKAILSNIEYMDQMIHDILELSKSEDGRQDEEFSVHVKL